MLILQILKIRGDVAQSVEQRTENPCVGGSIPSVTTFLFLGAPVFNRGTFLGCYHLYKYAFDPPFKIH